jgi:hypothetical protein
MLSKRLISVYQIPHSQDSVSSSSSAAPALSSSLFMIMIDLSIIVETNLTEITEYLDINSYVHNIGGEVDVSTTQCNNQQPKNKKN